LGARAVDDGTTFLSEYVAKAYEIMARFADTFTMYTELVMLFEKGTVRKNPMISKAHHVMRIFTFVTMSNVAHARGEFP